ncbi:hypothetical protein WJX73_004283 [Symbiochloris irregularis]|uniref:Uncharacterized protein n=1 Tax=Symbiochloris irregularis TaxID=706552 RepID=A0AAW1P104_9CHLO
MLRNSSTRNAIGFGFVSFLLAAPALITTVHAEMETKQLNAYYIGDRANIFSQAQNWQPGSVHPVNLVLTDQTTNVTQGEVRGYCVSIAQEESQCLHTVTFASGTIQIAGELFVPGGPSSGTPTNAGQDQGSILAVIGGTGLYQGASGYFLQTAPPTSPESLAAAGNATAPAPSSSADYQPLNGVEMQITYGATS